MNALACVSKTNKSALSFAAHQHYTNSEVRSWSGASRLEVMPIGMCASARQAVSKAIPRTPNIVALQGAVAGQPIIANSLEQRHYQANDVLAVQKRGKTLAVYVY
jgi:hypothetical protein